MNDYSLHAIIEQGCLLLESLTNNDFILNDDYYSWKDSVLYYLSSIIVDDEKHNKAKSLFDEFEGNDKLFNYQCLSLIIDELKSIRETHAKHAEKLKFYSSIYKFFGMNLTQMKWRDGRNIAPEKPIVIKNGKILNRAFKDPIDQDWSRYKYEEQTLDDIMSFDWDESCGIGVALGYNQFRAIDVDGVKFDHLSMYNYGSGREDFINRFLSILELPEDYPWMVLSGSGEGFHIIFKCEDIDDDIDSISLQPNNQYANNSIYLFERMELRWCDHLVLPPSIHFSGKQYSFINGEIPKSEPQKVKIKCIDELLTHFCGDRQWYNLKYNDKSFWLTGIGKIFSRHDSYLSPHDHKEDSIAWLEKVNDSEAVNNLAIRYLLGKDVEANAKKALELFEQSKTQSSLFNLVSLYACNVYSCDYNKFYSLYNQLDINIFNLETRQKTIENNISNNATLRRKKFLFFDTETTGVPQNREASTSDINNWPRLVQLSWILTNHSGKIISDGNYIIKPNGFVIPQEATNIHGITNGEAKAWGVPLEDALYDFLRDLSRADILVGHNVDFDKKVIGAECIRMGWDDELSDMPSVCTMKQTIDFCKIPNKYGYGYRFPKLQELYYKLFNRNFENSHDSAADVEATKDCFFELLERSIIKMPD